MGLQGEQGPPGTGGVPNQIPVVTNPSSPALINLLAGVNCITATETVHRFNYADVPDADICRIAPPTNTALFAEVYFYTTVGGAGDIDFADGVCGCGTANIFLHLNGTNIDQAGEGATARWLPELQIWSVTK